MTSEVPGLVEVPDEVLAEAPGEVRLVPLYTSPAAEMYDDIASSDDAEVRHLVGAVRRTRGPILELAAGSGRITLALTRLNRPVLALDSSADMLAMLTTRLANLPASVKDRATPLLGDITRLPDAVGDAEFGAVVLGTTSITLLDADGRRSLFGDMPRRLTDDGSLFLTLLDSAPPDGTHDEFEIPGASGRTYRLTSTYRRAVQGGRERLVTLRPSVWDRPDPVPMGVSRVAVLDPELILEEVRTAGLVARRITELDPTSAYPTALLEVGR